MRVLCTGDIHIGRRSSRLPSTIDPDIISAASAWKAIVDYAIDQQVDVVALSGDVVDQENRYFESHGPLERGLRKLGKAGIRTVAVAGNHDYNVLPALTKVLPSDCLTVLGIGGEWERVRLDGADGKSLYVDGWSFPTQHVHDNPIASYTLPAVHDAPVLGLLHADVDTTAGTYASVSLSDLQAQDVSFWLLGHIHAHRLCEAAGKPTVLYPGSPQPLDPGESGCHGAWLIDLSPGSRTPPRLIPLGTVLYQSTDVSITDARDLTALRTILVTEVRRVAQEAVDANNSLRCVSLRVRLTGRSSFQKMLGSLMDDMADDFESEIGGAKLYVERIENATRPDHDLEQLARNEDVVGTLARLIRELEESGSAEPPASTFPAGHDPLFRALRDIPRTLNAAKPYKSLGRSGVDGEERELHRALKAQATLLLDELLSQREAVA